MAGHRKKTIKEFIRSYTIIKYCHTVHMHVHHALQCLCHLEHRSREGVQGGGGEFGTIEELYERGDFE